MTSERWRQIEELYHWTREHGTAALADADPELRREVERLLAQDTSGGKILDRPASDLTITIIEVGSQLGPYRIESALGKGGMGTVYRARDTILKRDVAIKVLPESFARDPSRMVRFQREAEVLALLNHANIAQIYGIEEGALVMELVDGESPKGPLPFEKAWRIATQIADALEYAHERGVVHRDLKPANVKVTPDGTVKLLDFGLAKALRQTPDSGREDPDNSPAVTPAATVPGTIMGTVAYMAPEQAQGENVDKRADIWSWGVVLYELLTGEQMFKGNSVADTLAQVLTKSPDLDRTPANVRPLLAECLQKDPKHRLRDIGDARRLLTQTESAMQPAQQPARHTSLGWISAMLIASVLGAALWRTQHPGDPQLKSLVRLEVDLGTDVSLGSPAGTDVIISPDGARLVYVSRNRLLTRRLDQSKSSELAGTEGAFAPFFSPDSRWVGFFAGGKLKKISVEGGAAIPLCDVLNGRGGTWGEDGDIIVAPGGFSGLWRVSSSGGAPTAVTGLAQGEATHRWPQILPGNKAVLFTSNSGTDGVSYNSAKIEIVSLADHHRKVLAQGMFGRYFPASRTAGHLLYVNRGALFAVPFDPNALEVRGTPVPVLEQIASSQNFGFAQFDFSPLNGTLVYRTSAASGGELRTIQLLDNRGNTQPLLTNPAAYIVPHFSPDGRRLALSVGGDVFVYDLQRDNLTRLTFDRLSYGPVWYPDGRYIVFVSLGGMSWTRSDGSAKPQSLTQDTLGQSPWSFTPDGRNLVFQQWNARNDWDLWTVPVESDGAGLRAGKPVPFLQTGANEREAAFSPDGHWLAYASDESGSHQVYVRAFPDTGSKWQVSYDGGLYPVWSHSGRELFFQAEDKPVIMVATYTVKGDSFGPDKPRVWSAKPLADIGFLGINYDAAPDGKRIAAVMPSEGPRTDKQVQSQVIFLQNFADELRRRVPGGNEPR